MKLQQAQVWKQGDQFIRIVHLERLEVEYKATKSLGAKEGTHCRVTKKAFCRLLKGATLLPSGQGPLPAVTPVTPDSSSP